MLRISKKFVTDNCSPYNPPAARCRSGDTVQFETRDCYDDRLHADGSVTEPEKALENPATGPLYIEEAQPGDVLKVLDTIEEKPDYIVLDPPRDGIHPKAIEKIINYGVENMIYISCKPTSLARDLEIFLARGYDVKKICCVDMFPHTYHCETIAVLSK